MKQTVSKTIEKTTRKDRREGRGRVLALSRQVFNLSNKDTYYVESETTDNRYYFVRFNSSFSGGFCSCKDYESNRSEMCKHQHAIVYGIKYNTIQEVEHLPEEVRDKKSESGQIDENNVLEDVGKFTHVSKPTTAEKASTQFCCAQKPPCACEHPLSYESDDYTF